MKVFQIKNGLCFNEFSHRVNTAEEAYELWGDQYTFVDGPDYVFIGWGFDETQEGDARFVKPIPPEGCYYDDSNGAFYPIATPNVGVDIPDQTPESSIDEIALLRAQIQAMSDRNDFIEDCIAEMAMQLYS